MADEDEEMRQAAATDLTVLSYAQLYEKLSIVLNSGMHDEESDAEAMPYAAAFFSKLHSEAVRKGFRPKKDNNLPKMTHDELALLLELIRILVTKNTPLQKFKSVLTDTVQATFRSNRTLERILVDRRKNATAPPLAGPNAWSQKTPKAMQETLAADNSVFRFDTSVYSGEEIMRLRKLCTESYSFTDAPLTRKPVGDEWTIILGIMSGTIAVRAHPQFLKRCCNMAQFQWVHYQMIRRAEGELYAMLPAHVTVFNYNQTAKRLTDAILAAADYQKLDPRATEAMLQAVKTLAYNDELKSIHFFFDSKLEAIQFEGLIIPFRNLQLALKNPDARYREVVETPTGERKIIIRTSKDGLEDNRYDSQYRARVTNLTRTMEIDKVAKYINDLTGGAVKIAIPIDSYGAKSEHSLTWDFIFHTPFCPPELAKINRIMWVEHALMILHQGKLSSAPCHQCAEIGHQASTCKRPGEEWFTESTLIVTADMVKNIVTNRTTWTSPEEAKQLFESLGQYPEEAPAGGASNGPAVLAASGTMGATEQGVQSPVGSTAAAETPTATPPGQPATPAEGTNDTNSDQKGQGPSESDSTATAVKSETTNQKESLASDAVVESTGPAEPTKPAVSEGWKTTMSRYNARNKNQGRNKPNNTNGGAQGNKHSTGQRASQRGSQDSDNGKKETKTKDAGDTANHVNNSTESNKRNGAVGSTQKNEYTPYNDDEDNEHSDGDEDDDDDEDADKDKDEDEDEDEDDGNEDHGNSGDDCTVVEPTPAEKDANVGKADASKTKRRVKLSKLTRKEEEEELEAAIARANMERVGATIHRLAARNRPVMDKAACLSAITRAQTDKKRTTSSRKGTIEAINGTLLNSPATGNCFYMAMAEVLLQVAFVANKTREELLEITTLVKFVIYLANLVDPTVELDQSAAGHLLDFSAQELEDLTEAELLAKILAHYAAVAMSSSELNYILPRSLWGQTDAIRLLAKGLNRTIYVIIETNDPNVVRHMCFKPQRVKDCRTNMSVSTAVLQQLGYHQWLEEIKTEVEADLVPLVLSHTPEHYNAVLMHHNDELTQRRVPTKTQTLTELWGPALVKPGAPGTTQPLEGSDAEAEENGPTREQILQSQSSVHPSEIFRALIQDNWNRQEKKAAIDALVSGQDRIKELLVFFNDSSAMSDEEVGSSGVEEEMDTSDSEFTPPEGSVMSSGPTGEQQESDVDMGEGNSSMLSNQTSDYALPTPPEEAEHSQWGQVEWDRIVTEWAGQTGVQPPSLLDSAALYKFAAKYPEVMTELGSEHPNPFIVLDHFTDEAIKQWCHGKRMRYCIAELQRMIATVKEDGVRKDLTKWVESIDALDTPKAQLTVYREIQKWAHLKAHAALELATRPLVARNNTRECAFVLAMDALFPHLAADILSADGQEPDDGADLMQIYNMNGEFTSRLKRAAKAKSWNLMMEYVRSIGVHLSQPRFGANVARRF